MTATATKLGGSKRATMPPEREIDTSTYSGRVAARLRALRKEKDWTILTLTEAINRRLRARSQETVAASTVHGWDNGNRKIDPDYYPLLAAVFGLPVPDFLPRK